MTSKNEHTTQCQYVEKFIEHMWDEERIKLPVTLVNEFMSSMEAKARIAEMVSTPMGNNPLLEQSPLQALEKMIQIQETKKNELAIQATMGGGQVHSMISPQVMMSPEVMLRKGVYDKIAA